MAKIVTLETFGFPSPEAYLAALRATMPQLGQDPALMPAMTEIATGDDPAVAIVNHGRWLARCPDPGCRGGVEYVAYGLPFWCCACANVGAGHRWRVVLWPEEREAIERILARRPHPHNRNWTPGETLGRLQTESIVMPGVKSS